MSRHLRPAAPGDAPGMGEILWWFQQSHDWMPELYTLLDCIHFCQQMIERGWITVAANGDTIRGFIARDGEEICSLYLARPAKGQGIGKALLDDAKNACDALNLRCFQANTGAQRFYRREGFAETARGDGSDNEEKLPDITYVWQREGMA